MSFLLLLLRFYSGKRRRILFRRAAFTPRSNPFGLPYHRQGT